MCVCLVEGIGVCVCVCACVCVCSSELHCKNLTVQLPSVPLDLDQGVCGGEGGLSIQHWPLVGGQCEVG